MQSSKSLLMLAAGNSNNQLCKTQTQEKREKMSRDNPRVEKITEALTQHIALDDQLLSFVDNSGFCRLLGVLELSYKISSRHSVSAETLQLHSTLCVCARPQHVRALIALLSTRVSSSISDYSSVSTCTCTSSEKKS